MENPQVEGPWTQPNGRAWQPRFRQETTGGTTRRGSGTCGFQATQKNSVEALGFVCRHGEKEVTVRAKVTRGQRSTAVSVAEPVSHAFLRARLVVAEMRVFDSDILKETST